LSRIGRRTSTRNRRQPPIEVTPKVPSGVVNGAASQEPSRSERLPPRPGPLGVDVNPPADPNDGDGDGLGGLAVG
jgi:hypothetical protein